MSGLMPLPGEEPNEELRLINDIYAENPSLWAEDYFGLTLDGWQIKMLDSQSKRTALNIHRQGGKSTMSSLICLHMALFRPGSLSLIIAPALRQSQENFLKIRGFIDQLDKVPKFDESTKLSLKFDTGSRILCLPGGNDGKTIRGFSRPDVIVEDEAAQCSDELHYAIMPMMATFPDCRFVMASTPFGQRGHYYKIWNESTVWEKYTLKASQNPRISSEYLAEMKATIGPYMYAQEFECEFVASNTQLISHDTILKAHDSSIRIIEI
ncbi:hypothetical protein M0R72_11255 [Candidatus Pacearchaeota archaeon]|jgi:hypothetical protein|nr:hypothetical protein [Candidatus Pacearchaeota archaeon]